ncbi:hypothetical protein B0H63DRAFT_463288 [Podospora didyma]|uniref:Uncharacterized protein n=1 Tax=Podospora didyma TaxID=330526 RepID=A0AAE0NWZ1_9PEZI|nr:hypothetical protein B0H63DRAFT_463288 [Podospora didyma]
MSHDIRTPHRVVNIKPESVIIVIKDEVPEWKEIKRPVTPDSCWSVERSRRSANPSIQSDEWENRSVSYPLLPSSESALNQQTASLPSPPSTKGKPIIIKDDDDDDKTPTTPTRRPKRQAAYPHDEQGESSTSGIILLDSPPQTPVSAKRTLKFEAPESPKRIKPEIKLKDEDDEDSPKKFIKSKSARISAQYNNSPSSSATQRATPPAESNLPDPFLDDDLPAIPLVKQEEDRDPDEWTSLYSLWDEAARAGLPEPAHFPARGPIHPKCGSPSTFFRNPNGDAPRPQYRCYSPQCKTPEHDSQFVTWADLRDLEPTKPCYCKRPSRGQVIKKVDGTYVAGGVFWKCAEAKCRYWYTDAPKRVREVPAPVPVPVPVPVQEEPKYPDRPIRPPDF